MNTIITSIFTAFSLLISILSFQPQKTETDFRFSPETVLQGTASTYGWGEPLGEHTCCGDDFDPMIVAVALPAESMSRSLCGQTAHITYKDKTIEAVIWDSGGFGKLGRIADLTQGASRALGINNPTVFQITLEY